MDYVIGVDIGGTCTDCVVLDQSGQMTVGKAFSTPPEFSGGVLDAVRITAAEAGISLGTLLKNTRLFLHATTIADNAVIQGNLAKAGMLVTRGFESTLQLMRGGYSEWSGRTEEEIKNIVYARKPPTLVPLSMIKGIKERVDSQGEVFAPMDEKEVKEAVSALVADGAEAIGVAFLWSFINTSHELMAQSIIEEMQPGMFCTTSHQIAPVLGEFERMQTVALNIKLGPAVSSYLTTLEEDLSELGYSGPVLIMQAYGGLLSGAEAATRPVSMIESGPVSGLVGCRALGEKMGFQDIIGADMGGTTFKAGIIGGGMIDYAREPMVLQYHYASPKMNMESIGLAGGSIVSLDPNSRTPKIGPKSAGSYPGPICYGNGGTEPTISDVDLLLGYLDDRYFLSGRRQLQRKEAETALAQKIAEPLGLNVMEAAGEIYRLANSMIYDMLHKLTVERGVDPRKYVLFSYGGTLGMHVTSFAPELGVKAIIIPYSASVHGAAGLVTSNVTYEEQITHPLQVPADLNVVNGIFRDLHAKVVDKLKTDGFGDEDIRIMRSIDMRYRRQIHVVTTPLETEDDLEERDIEPLLDAFDRFYEERFGAGSAYRVAGVEMVNFRLRGVGVLHKTELRGEKPGGSDPAEALVETNEVYFGRPRQVLSAPCYDFGKLSPGNVVTGPAVIWSPITTVVVNPEQEATMDEFKSLKITW